jgi:hypothetical protein
VQFCHPYRQVIPSYTFVDDRSLGVLHQATTVFAGRPGQNALELPRDFHGNDLLLLEIIAGLAGSLLGEMAHTIFLGFSNEYDIF